MHRGLRTYGAVFVLITVLLAGCVQPGGPEAQETPDIAYSVTANGVANDSTSTALAFVFAGAVNGLTAEDISLANGTGAVTKGALSGEGTGRSLAIGVTAAGTVKVRINKDGIDPAEKTVTVHRERSPGRPRQTAG